MQNGVSEQGRLVRFLLVEDDVNHAEIVRRGLMRARVANEMAWVQDGEMALDYLRKRNGFEQSFTPDVVLLDLKLPKKDGHEVLEEIRSDADLCLTPVVILSTSAAEEDREKAYGLKANSYLIKPLNFECFKRLVDEFSFYWGVWNAPPSDRKMG